MPAAPRTVTLKACCYHALSIHGVGLSLGGPSAPAAEDLAARRALLDR